MFFLFSYHISVYIYTFPKGVQPIFAEFWSDHHWTVLLHPFWRSKLTYLRPRTRSQLARKVGEGNEAPKALTHRLKVRDVFSGVSIGICLNSSKTITIPKTSSQTNSFPLKSGRHPKPRHPNHLLRFGVLGMFFGSKYRTSGGAIWDV